jgi:hypothetical protein
MYEIQVTPESTVTTILKVMFSESDENIVYLTTLASVDKGFIINMSTFNKIQFIQVHFMCCKNRE